MFERAIALNEENKYIYKIHKNITVTFQIKDPK
jgi:hypothetical protein